MISGVNPGANVGRAVYHSGTVGAALTARNGKISGVAFSQAVTGYPSGVKAWIIYNESFNINNDTLQMRVAKGLMNQNKAYNQGQATHSAPKSKPKKLAPIKWLSNTQGT